MVAYSGGKDSDIILSLLKHHNLLNKVQLVMFDTGIEFEANKKHISKLISEGIDIKIIRAKNQFLYVLNNMVSLLFLNMLVRC